MATQGAGPAVYRLVRFWSRRWAPDVVDKLSPDAPETWTVQNLYVTEAINTASETVAEVTVADVARQLGLDRSVASRMIADAVADGYVRREASPRDARRAKLTLTTTAELFVAAAHDHQQRTFDGMIQHWPAEDQEQFSRYLRRLADEVLS